MKEIIALIIFLIGFIGTLVVIRRKIPVLANLVVEEVEPKMKPLEEIKEKIRRNGSFSLRRFLERTLSKFRIITLKTENKTSNLLSKLRQKSIEEKNKFSEDYWKRVKRKR
jgi:hypothetical protein